MKKMKYFIFFIFIMMEVMFGLLFWRVNKYCWIPLILLIIPFFQFFYFIYGSIFYLYYLSQSKYFYDKDELKKHIKKIDSELISNNNIRYFGDFGVGKTVFIKKIFQYYLICKYQYFVQYKNVWWDKNKVTGNIKISIPIPFIKMVIEISNQNIFIRFLEKLIKLIFWILKWIFNFCWLGFKIEEVIIFDEPNKGELDYSIINKFLENDKKTILISNNEKIIYMDKIFKKEIKHLNSKYIGCNLRRITKDRVKTLEKEAIEILKEQNLWNDFSKLPNLKNDFLDHFVINEINLKEFRELKESIIGIMEEKNIDITIDTEKTTRYNGVYEKTSEIYLSEEYPFEICKIFLNSKKNSFSFLEEKLMKDMEQQWKNGKKIYDKKNRYFVNDILNYQSKNSKLDIWSESDIGSKNKKEVNEYIKDISIVHILKLDIRLIEELHEDYRCFNDKIKELKEKYNKLLHYIITVKYLFENDFNKCSWIYKKQFNFKDTFSHNWIQELYKQEFDIEEFMENINNLDIIKRCETIYKILNDNITNPDLEENKNNNLNKILEKIKIEKHEKNEPKSTYFNIEILKYIKIHKKIIPQEEKEKIKKRWSKK